MWQPNRAQWAVIWSAAALLILAWPPDSGRSLLIKSVNLAADPSGSLPVLPAPLPMGLDDNGDAVAAHDGAEAEYYRRRNASRLTRWRMAWKDTDEPLDPSTERQILIGVAVLSALAVWRLNGRQSRSIG
jgi:hypothetical protein